MYSIAIFGGTFDPVHYGHLQTSIAIQKAFIFDSYRFLPCKIPPLKAASIANSQQRVAMLQLAIDELNKNAGAGSETTASFSIDLREIKRSTPSYMIDTLKSFREEYKEASITLILGYDAFNSLNQWHQWQDIINYAHLVVINRNTLATASLPDSVKSLLKTRQQSDKKIVKQQASGAIYEFNAGTYDSSSTEIRAALKQGQDSTIKEQVPKHVYQYIKSTGLYQ